MLLVSISTAMLGLLTIGTKSTSTLKPEPSGNSIARTTQSMGRRWRSRQSVAKGWSVSRYFSEIRLLCTAQSYSGGPPRYSIYSKEFVHDLERLLLILVQFD